MSKSRQIAKHFDEDLLLYIFREHAVSQHDAAEVVHTITIAHHELAQRTGNIATIEEALHVAIWW